MISVVINTLNVERTLPYTLRSVRAWADELVVVDMHSEDRTVEIARDFGARVIPHERIGFVEPARAFAIDQAFGDWILVLDADELVPLPLSVRFRAIASTDAADVVIVSRLNYLHDTPILHTGWEPQHDRHPRFFKRGFLHASSTIHRPLTPTADARVLVIPYAPEVALIHFNFLDFADLLEKVNRYTTVEADQAFARGERVARFGWLSALQPFWRRYIRARGYRDGWRGFALALFMVSYRLEYVAKLKERAAVGAREAIAAACAREAERWLAPYEAGDPPSLP